MKDKKWNSLCMNCSTFSSISEQSLTFPSNNPKIT